MILFNKFFEKIVHSKKQNIQNYLKHEKKNWKKIIVFSFHRTTHQIYFWEPVQCYEGLVPPFWDRYSQYRFICSHFKEHPLRQSISRIRFETWYLVTFFWGLNNTCHPMNLRGTSWILEGTYGFSSKYILVWLKCDHIQNLNHLVYLEVLRFLHIIQESISFLRGFDRYNHTDTNIVWPDHTDTNFIWMVHNHTDTEYLTDISWYKPI